MRKFLITALVALMLFATTGILTVAAPNENAATTALNTAQLGVGEVHPGGNGQANPFEKDVTPDNPIHVGE